MSIRRSRGRFYPRGYSITELPPAAATVGERDPNTGRFATGNRVGRRKTFKRIGQNLPWLPEESAPEWLAPYIRGAKQHVAELLAEAGDAQSPAINGMAEELAASRMILRGLLSLACSGDKRALAEARAWQRETRSNLLAFTGLIRTASKGQADEFDRWIRLDNERALAEVAAVNDPSDDDGTPG